MKLLYESLVDGSFLLDVEADDLASVFRQTLNHLVSSGQLSTEKRDEAEAALLAREKQAPTVLGLGAAAPHAYLDFIEHPTLVLVRLASPLDLGAPDRIPTRLLFIMLGPPDRASEHLDLLLRIVWLIQDDEFRYAACEARSKQELLSALESYRERTAPPAPVAALPELKRTGRWCGGLIEDLRRRLPYYAQDFRDGLHPKCLSSVLFLFFACLAPAVTFGGFMAAATGGQIGTVEMLVGTAVCGILFALCSGQPLVILGGTGPLLVFTGVLFKLCQDWEIPEHFLSMYVWTGLWTAVFLFLAAASDASFLMRYFTRFTDEIFAALISLIFLYESIMAILNIFQEAYRRESISHDTALLTLLLAIGTFYIASNLSRFRRSRYLRPRAREFLADFGPAIAMAAMTITAMWFHGAVPLRPLQLPQSFGTTTGRGWFVNPLSAPVWIWLAASGPALLATVLVFLDQNITARLINSPKHKLQKGAAYHLDLAVVGALVGLCSLFGLPWLVAATVRSLNHVKSLATIDEVVTSSGVQQERVTHVRENRVTGLAIHLSIGAALFLLPLLRNIPMAVLYGLFLFMGVVSMHGNQFFERLNLWFMDSSRYPTTHYIRKVPGARIHLFTALQLAGLIVLWGVKVSPLAILFPLFIALGVPMRLFAGKLFTPEQLAALDAEEDPQEDETQWR